MESVIKVFMFLYLLFQSYEDVKKRSITIKSIIIFSLIAMIINLITNHMSIINMILGISIGLAIVLVGKLMRNAIGVGDGALLASMGILLGGEECFLIFVTAITLSAIVAVILLLLKKVNLKQELPFIPYILCAYVIMII